jgi:hypothetical protein
MDYIVYVGEGLLINEFLLAINEHKRERNSDRFRV